jgi:hypothetical protein
VPFGQLSDRGLAVVRRAAELGRRSGGVNPAHLLAAVLEVSGPLGEMAAVAHAPAPRKSRSDDEPAPETVAHYDTLARQAIDSAVAWAVRRGARAGPEDLFIVLVDQHSPAVVAALARMGPESERLRLAALRMLGLPDHYGPVPLEPLQAAGTSERSLLEIEELPADLWADLVARQARLPVHRVRRRSDWAAVVINEQRAVRKVASRRNATDHESHALLHHHLRAVQRRGAEAVPGLVPQTPSPLRDGSGADPLVGPRSSGFLPAGWVAWIANRRMALKVAWFRWTAQRY